MIKQVEKISIKKAIELINSCGYTNRAVHHYDRNWKIVVKVNEINVDDFIDINRSFGYETQTIQTPSDNKKIISSLKSGDEINIRKFIWGRETDALLNKIPYGSHLVPEYDETFIIE